MTTTIPFPASQARRFDSLGGRAGSRLPDRTSLRRVDLPPGWTADGHRCDRGGVPRRIRDQHGRPRVTVDWTYHATPGSLESGEYTRVTASVLWHDPESHARDVAEHGAVLVLDEWATPAAMLPSVTDRVDGFTQMIEVVEDWTNRHPGRAAQERDNLAGYLRKRDAYAALQARLTAPGSAS